jgi:hypothetical protein
LTKTSKISAKNKTNFSKKSPNLPDSSKIPAKFQQNSSKKAAKNRQIFSKTKDNSDDEEK